MPSPWTPTPRQLEIVERVAAGQPDKRIAYELGISVSTVRAHIDHIAAMIPGQAAPKHRILMFFFGVKH
jgi:FixJ family two-component response regulator